ncbi:hypothetical protein HanIR_Chr13g0655841 [Helianthus annuus]|nr:hypothetical protein HanIR_Chr13g0655841 [Helianthus annuus]
MIERNRERTFYFGLASDLCVVGCFTFCNTIVVDKRFLFFAMNMKFSC